MARKQPLVSIVLATLAATGAFAQRLEFEVASVKQNTSHGDSDLAPRRSGDLVLMHNIRVYTAIYYAWHLHGGYQIVGYPDTPAAMEWYDIDARVGRNATDDELRLMMQALLEDRFKLKVRHEMRDIPQYELVVAKGKPKLTPSDGKEPLNVVIENAPFGQAAGRCSTSSWLDGYHVVCHAASMSTISTQLSAALRAPLVDHTGLTGTYDLHFRFVPEERRLRMETNDPGPTLQQAVQEELGLRLEKAKGQVDVLVIDHLEKPAEN